MSRQTFRSERYPEYKANRSASPSEFAGQVSLVKEVLPGQIPASIEVLESLEPRYPRSAWLAAAR